MKVMQILSFVDLDDTLFQSHRKCEGKDIMHLCAKGSTKERSSYMAREQVHLFNMLSSCSLVIPTTARDVDSFNNVKLNWDGPAILNHGGTVLKIDGTEDLEWKATMEQKMDGVPEILKVFQENIINVSKVRDLNIRTKLVGESPLYLVIKHNDSRADVLEKLKHEIIVPMLSSRGSDFYIHINDNNLAILPACLNKVHAVRYVLETYFADSKVTTFGVGDSVSDFDFMSVCDFVISPSGSQLIKTLKEK